MCTNTSIGHVYPRGRLLKRATSEKKQKTSIAAGKEQVFVAEGQAWTGCRAGSCHDLELHGEGSFTIRGMIYNETFWLRGADDMFSSKMK